MHAPNEPRELHEERDVLRRIAWKQVFPWLILFKSFAVSISLPVLFLATAGVAAMPLGWRAAEWLFIEDGNLAAGDFRTYVDANSRWPLALPAPAGELPPSSSLRWLWSRSQNLAGVYWTFTEPFQRLLDPQLPVTRCAYLLFGGLWNLVIWGFLGAAITRIAAVQLGREERLGFWEAIKHTARNYLWYVFAPLFPILGMLVVGLPVLATGFLMRLDLGVLASGIVWPLILACGLIMVMFLLGLFFGWPLLWPTISCEEGSDAFEAFSRSYSYTFQRPLQYLFYASVTVLFGAICWMLVWGVAQAVIDVSQWAATWGAGQDRLDEVVSTPRDGSLVSRGLFLIGLAEQLVGMIALAFNFSFFWCAATAIYLLLRRDVDQTDFDEVFVEDDVNLYALPQLTTDNSGVPTEPSAAAPDVPDATAGEEA